MKRLPGDRFVPFPNELMDALIRVPLTGSQFRILLWVVRQTVGWNRGWVRFSWYALARELGLDRAATYRAGVSLIAAKILLLKDKSLAIQPNVETWSPGVASKQRKAMPDNNGSVVLEQQPRCQEATVFRRAKDRCKDKEKTYRKTAWQKHAKPTAGPMSPSRGKYDHLSES